MDTSPDRDKTDKKIDPTDKNNNKYIAQNLGLDETLDFMNDSNAIRQAEQAITRKGLDSEYLQALNQMDSSGKTKSNLSDFQTQKPGFKAFAIVKMFYKKES